MKHIKKFESFVLQEGFLSKLGSYITGEKTIVAKIKISAEYERFSEPEPFVSHVDITKNTGNIKTIAKEIIEEAKKNYPKIQAYKIDDNMFFIEFGNLKTHISDPNDYDTYVVIVGNDKSSRKDIWDVLNVESELKERARREKILNSKDSFFYSKPEPILDEDDEDDSDDEDDDDNVEFGPFYDEEVKKMVDELREKVVKNTNKVNL